MNRADFEARAKSDGFTLVERAMPPHEVKTEHTHEFDARLLILDGALTLARGDSRETFTRGQTCEVAAGVPHQEITAAEGVTYLAARRHPAEPRAAAE